MFWISNNHFFFRKFIIFFITIFSDITELKENRDKFEQYVKYSPYGIYVTDSTGKIILVNPVLCRSIGYTEDELLNKSVIDMLTQSNRADGMDGICNVTIYNTSGTIVFQHTGSLITINNALDNTTFSTSGMYFLRLNNNANTFETRFICLEQ